MCRKNSLSILLLPVFLIFFGVPISEAQTPQVHIAPKPSWISTFKEYDKKPSARTIRDGYFYDLDERQIQVEQKAQYTHYIREIVSATGIQNGSEISVSFDPVYERLDFHQITVWRNGQPQDRLKLSAFKVLADEQEFSKFIYQGSYSANVILDDIRKGDKIEYAFTITGRNPIFNNHFATDIYLQGSRPIAHQYVSLVASASHKLKIKVFNKAAKPVVSNANGLSKYTWEDFLIQPVVSNDNEPSWYNAYNYAEITDYNSWAEVVNWALSINQPSLLPGGGLAKLITDLKAKSKDKTTYFRNAVRVVQDEVRYMGIETGEYSHRANRPEKVYDQRYGDCKDKSLLLVSILKANGIDAYMVLANTELDDKIDQLMPTSNAFNHAVVVAYIDGKQVWVDATISDQGGDGTDIYFPDYGKGLILKTGNGALATIPVTKTGKVVCEEKYTGSSDEKAQVALDVKTIYTLDQADRERSRLESAGMAQTEKDYLDYYSKVYSKIEARDSIKVIDDLHTNTLTTIESYFISNFYKRDSLSGRAGVEFYASYISQSLPSVSNQGTAPVAVDYPYNTDYTIKMILPGGWDITNKHDSFSRDSYRFSSDYSARGDTLLLNYKLAYLKDHVAADKVNEFKKDISNLKDNNGLSYAIDYPMFDPPFSLNIWSAGLGLLIAGAAVYAGMRIYRTETPGIVFTRGSSFIPVGGWLLLILSSLFLAIIVMGCYLYNGAYFSLSKWNIYTREGSALPFRALILFETAGYVAIIAFSIFCAILLLKKRDILPRMIMVYYISAVVFFILDYFFATEVGLATEWHGYAIIGSMIMAGAGISYVKSSPRVEHTFIVPYPSDNFSYEEAPEK